MRNMSIRLRLTLLYSMILALTLITFSTVLYVAQANSTYENIKNNLVRQADGLAARMAGGPREGAPIPGLSPEAAPPPAPRPSDGTLPGRWTQTRSITGTITARSLDLGTASLPLSQQGLLATQSGNGWFETVQFEEQPLLIYSHPFTSRTNTAEIVQVAFPITQPEQSLNALRLILIIGSSLVTAAAVAVGWVLAGTALHPIDRITHTAQAIGAEHDFARRVKHDGPADEVGRLAVTFNDMLARLETAYRQLENALDSQRRFVADASHELRTPLTTVRGNVELLQREPPLVAEERAEVMADTRDEVDRLIRLVNQLLVLARADSGQKLHRELLPLRPLIEDVCRQTRLLAPQGQIDCQVSIEASVLGDRDALKQVLLILVDNALVHSAPGTAIALTSDLAAGRVLICVRDAGPGIAANVLPHVFERFYRGDVARSGRGSGLGLAIAKELIEAQDGTISVQSEIGRGTVFTISLPEATAEG